MSLLQQKEFTEEECDAAYRAMVFGGYDRRSFDDVLGSYIADARKEAIWDVYMFACAVQGEREEEGEHEEEDDDLPM